jgi:hypothetical protein
MQIPPVLKRNDLERSVINMTPKAKPRSLSSAMWETLENPKVSTEFLEDFSLNTEDKAIAGFKLAFKNIKRRKNFQKVKHLVKNYESLVKEVYLVFA